MCELGGVVPDTAEDLVKQLPGVGRYTAGEDPLNELHMSTLYLIAPFGPLV